MKQSQQVGEIKYCYFGVLALKQSSDFAFL